MKNTLKDDNLLTTSSLAISRRGVYLGVSMVLLLTGCSMPSFSNIFSDERDEQRVDGGRRAPAYNNHSMNSQTPAATIIAAEAKTKLPPMVTTVSPQKVETSLDSPYDKYDASGNEVEVQDTGVQDANAAQPENKQEEKKWFFSNWFGSDEETHKETADAVESAVPMQKVDLPSVARKPFLGNPYTPRPPSGNQAPSVTPLLAVDPKAEPQVKDDSREPRITFVDNSQPEKPAASVPEPVSSPVADNANINFNTVSNAEPEQKYISNAEPEQKYNSMPGLYAESPPSAEAASTGDETLLGRIGSKLDVFELSDRGPDKTPADYPEVSSVPQRPAEFDAIKREQQQNLDELKQDHGISQKGRELLEREAATSDLRAPSVAQQPAAESAPEKKVEQPVPAAPSSASGNSNVEDNNASETVEATSDEQPDFFDRLLARMNISKTDTNHDEIKPVDDFVSKQAESPSSSGSVPVSSLNEVNIEAKPENNNSEYSNATTAANVAQDPSFQPAENITGAALPSPDIIKTMRPSRYETRRTEFSGY